MITMTLVLSLHYYNFVGHDMTTCGAIVLDWDFELCLTCMYKYSYCLKSEAGIQL